MPINEEILYKIEGAGIALPDWLIRSREVSAEVAESVPEAIAHLTRGVWDPDRSHLENLIEIGRARAFQTAAGDMTQHLESIATEVLRGDLAKRKVELFDYLITCLWDMKARLTEALSNPEVSQNANRRVIDISQIPRKLVDGVLIARGAIDRASAVLNGVADVFYDCDVNCGQWLLRNPSDYSVATWVQINAGDELRGSARAHGNIRPVLKTQHGRNLEGADLPKDFEELKAREQVLIDAERNSNTNSANFYEDDTRNIRDLAAMPRPRAEMARPTGRAPAATLAQHDAQDSRTEA